MLTQSTLSDFFEYPPAQRQEILLEKIFQSHAWHYSRNQAYRQTAEAKGIGQNIMEEHLERVLRPTAQVFKSYIDILGTPFPEEHPQEFLEWLSQNLSIPLPQDRFRRFKRRYKSLESFLSAIEDIFSDLGFVIGTSSGTSGKATIMVRDSESADMAIESYKLAVYRMWGTKDHHQIIFIMPARTRIVMAWVARLATERLGMKSQSHFAIPFSATPDHVRIRSGQMFKSGLRGKVEEKILYPFMNRMNETRAKKMYVGNAIDWLEQFSASGQDVLLFGGWIQLDEVYEGLIERKNRENGNHLKLSSDSMIGTGGGVKEMYPYSPAEIRDHLGQVFVTPSGESIPHRDVYGMAEANWAAAQCQYGNYHLPPWVYAVVLDDHDKIIPKTDATGLLAFFDPIAGGKLFPNFFKTADRVRLINAGQWYDQQLECPCGYRTTFIACDSIIRQDRLDEAGCAAQI